MDTNKETEAEKLARLETWDRLILLLIARPLEGWEREFEEITRREVKRLYPSSQDS